MVKNKTIKVEGRKITIISQQEEGFISLTDMAGYKDNLKARVVVSNWVSMYYTVDFLAVWK